jgi:hypothetical protein
MMVVHLAHIAVHGTSASSTNCCCDCNNVRPLKIIGSHFSPWRRVHPDLAEDGSICILVSAPTACNILISSMSVSGPSLMSLVSMIFIATPKPTTNAEIYWGDECIPPAPCEL